eukprot:3447850-Prymnesium_polylepis.1
MYDLSGVKISAVVLEMPTLSMAWASANSESASCLHKSGATAHAVVRAAEDRAVESWAGGWVA